MTKCKKLSLDEIAKKLAATKGRKLTAEEKAGLKLLPPQYACDRPHQDVSGLSSSTKARDGHVGFRLDADDQAAYDAAAIQASGGSPALHVKPQNGVPYTVKAKRR